MPKFLISGGAGFIASCLAERLLESSEDNYVVIVDNLLTGKKANLPSPSLPNWHFVQADVNKWEDIAPIMTQNSFDYVFHYAAVVGVQRTLDNPLEVLADIDGIKNMLSLAKNTRVKRFFYASSSEVYGISETFPQHELHTPLNARLPYAVVKNMGEVYCKTYQETYGLPYTIFRFFNTYGPKQSVDFVMSKFIKAALAQKDITIYGDGEQKRTFCYIDDHLDATVACLSNNDSVNQTINIGNDQEISIADLAAIIVRLTNSSSKIIHTPPLKEGDMPRRQPDITNMKKLLGRNLTPIELGIQKILDAYNSI